MDSIISISDVRKELLRFKDSEIAIRFNISFVTANRQRKTGGEIIKLDNCLLMKNQNGRPRSKNYQPIVRELLRDPNHHRNQTFNIVQEDSQTKFTVHTNLITRFQNKKVVAAHYE